MPFERIARRNPPMVWAFAATAALAAAIELAITWFLHVAPSMWPFALGAHAAVSLGLVVWVVARHGREDEDRLFLILAVAVPFTGALGAVALLILLPLYLRDRSRATPFAEWYRALFPDGDRFLPAQLYQSIMRRERPGSDYAPVISYMDVIAHGTPDQRSAVIATVARNFRPVFAPVLKAAIAQTNPEIRVQAASAIAKITDDFVKRMQALERTVAARPKDTAALRDLAKTYDDYAYTGILDSTIEENNRRRALQLWLKYCALVPDDRGALLAVGRLLMRLERHHLAAQWLERVFADGRATRQAVLWYMEALFVLGRTDALRALAGQTAGDLMRDRTLSAKAVSAAQLWASGTVAETPGAQAR